MWWREPAGAAT